MRKLRILGLAGLLMAGTGGCETNRPYCTHCMLARNNYGQSETSYRPKTTVTMRAEEVPENPTAVQVCPTVQVVSATGTSVVQTSGQTSTSAPMVTVTIPAMKIVIPMTATVGNSPSPPSETPTITQLPAVTDSVVHADVKAPAPAQTLSVPIPDNSVQSAVHKRKIEHVQKEEPASAPPEKIEPLPIPELPPEPKPLTKASGKDADQARLPRLSLLPPDPPPDVPLHRAAVANPARNSVIEMPPPPPPIPKSGPSSGPVLPSPDPDL